MKGLLANIWFPIAFTAAVASALTGGSEAVRTLPAAAPSASPDTVTYDPYGYRRGWTAEESGIKLDVADSLLALEAAEFDAERPVDTLEVVQEEVEVVEEIDPEKAEVDSLFALSDSTVQAMFDEWYLEDSTLIAQNIFDHWYAGLSSKERRQYDREVMLPIIQARKDSIADAKAARKAYKDSVFKATPRILNTYFLPDSMQYKRIISWTHDRNFHDLNLLDAEQSEDFNYRFNDYPFLRKDVNATWLGTAGSPVLYNNFFNRNSEEGESFYDALESWTFSASSLPMYNTKTAYTELAYAGTLFESEQTTSHNIHVMTTQNIMPEWNFTVGYDRYGSEGMLSDERVANKTLYAHTSYVGEKYLLHAGYISNTVSQKENGAIEDNFWIRDTTVDAREINVYLKEASSLTKKKTLFLDQQYRIPLTFFKDLFNKKDKEPEVVQIEEETDLEPGQEEEQPDPEDLHPEIEEMAMLEDEELAALADSTAVEEDVTTAFIGHSTEFTRIYRQYNDKMNTTLAKEFYRNTAYLHPNTASDSLGVTKFDNKVFIRLQPWSKEAIVSKLDVGAGLDIKHYALADPYYLHTPQSNAWTDTYIYAGAQGQFRNYFQWNALGHYSLLGNEAGDFDISANALFQFYPFRRARTSPIILNLSFSTALEEPGFYVQHMLVNHYKWENDFDKISTSKFQGTLSIPRWKLEASVNYALLVNNIYYDTKSLPTQNTDPMSILSVTLNKDLELFKFLHLDHRVLFQMSSNQEVVPLPTVSANARYYVQFGINNAMTMQLGANVFFYTKYYLQRWNPNVGIFYNQTKIEYGNAPYIDAFANMKWQNACVFVKWENAGMGWPLDYADYFSADGHIRTPRIVKVGLFWVFHPNPAKPGNQSSSDSHQARPGGQSGRTSNR